tara:strand:- start:1536 stop:2468 length:933 start_codon:yes stop_codon:yes gene_type:complete
MRKNLVKKLLIIFFLFLSTEKLVSETNNSIIITVGNYPITRLDLVKEIKFITVLSKIQINEKNRESIKNLAIQTLVKRAIKKNEIDRLKITQYSSRDLELQILNIARNLGLDKEGLKIFLRDNSLDYDDVIKNFEIDLKWNTAIFKLYKNKITLNTIEIEDKIKSELEKLGDGKSVLLSEIQVNLLGEGVEATADKVLSKIKESGFEIAAKDISISSSAKNGGSIGWIEEEKLSQKIYSSIKNLKKGEISKPITIGETIIFIKKYDEKSLSSDLEGIKKNIVKREKMKKLEMFSNSHYSDLERKTKVRFL